MLTTLWVMRHGLAVDQFESDFTRALSATGKLQAQDVARQLLAEGGELPQRILVSPFTRTQQTAQQVQAVLQIAQPFETEEMLVHFGDHRLLGDYLMSLPEERVMIISHMPIVARLCEYISPQSSISGFQTAQVAKLQAGQSHGMTLVNSYLAAM